MASPTSRSNATALTSIVSETLVASWGGESQQESIFAAVSTALANQSSLQLTEPDRGRFPEPTWAHVADVMRLADCSKWRDQTMVKGRDAVGYRMLQIFFGDGRPSSGGDERLVRAVHRVIHGGFDEQAKVAANASKRKDGKYDLRASRVRLAAQLPWSMPAVANMRALLADSRDSTQRLRMALKGSETATAEQPPTAASTASTEIADLATPASPTAEIAAPTSTSMTRKRARRPCPPCQQRGEPWTEAQQRPVPEL